MTSRLKIPAKKRKKKITFSVPSFVQIDTRPVKYIVEN